METSIPWLKWNLSRKLDSRLNSAASNNGVSTQLASLVSPAVDALRGYETVVVPDGTLLNHSHQPMLGANQQVFRSVSLDAGKIQQNVQNWANEASLSPEDFEVVNALPQNQADLERLGFAGADWPQWQSFHEYFSKAVPKGVSVTPRATKAVSINALQTKKSVLFVVAHSDGFSIRFPGGESLDVKDLEAVKAQIDRLERTTQRCF